MSTRRKSMRTRNALSGEAYITHPLAVAGAVVEWRMDSDAIMAALLHDVLEDTGTTKRELSDKFGREVAELVDGLSKLDKMEFATPTRKRRPKISARC
jgi:guanosine-3',5'-bis(diphosphate) 3'-pyrophosphohydrolase